ncbi:MAG: hemolysin III family protein [Vulcanibacillus sp.]
MFLRMREPVNALTHLIGTILSAIGLTVLIYIAVIQATSWHIVTFSIYGASMILLYTASTLYHSLNLSEKSIEIFHKIDHMMIYVLIAGTYTPICLIPLRGGWGWSLFGVVWFLAITGILLKIFWFDAPRWLSTLFYVIMGWVVVIAFVPLINSVPFSGLMWLIAGGVSYTIGALIYGLKKPNIFKKFLGFHEIFHLFVLGGSFCHFIFMLRYVMYIV